MVPADSDWIPRVPPYSGYCLKQVIVTCTSLSLSMDRLSRQFQFLTCPLSQSYYPDDAVTSPVWATASSLAATKAIDVSFFSSSYLDVSVQRVSPRFRVTDFCLPGCPIRISADLFSFANPRGFSQLSTSFFASKSLGIPHTPLFYFIPFLYPLLKHNSRHALSRYLFYYLTLSSIVSKNFANL